MTYSDKFCVDCCRRLTITSVRWGAMRCPACRGIWYQEQQAARDAVESPRAIAPLRPKTERPSTTAAGYLAWLREWAVEQRAFLWWLAMTRDQKWGDFYRLTNAEQERYRAIGRDELLEDSPRLRLEVGVEFNGVGCA